MAHLHRTLGFALGGEPGSRLAAELAVPTSADTILRRVKATPAEPETSYRFVGIDDFALRKGQTYGTILVDLERGRVIDLFDGRDGLPVTAWLKLHPGIDEVITRDRLAAYANAGSAGAAQALQVADRWHLIGNIRELVERLFEQHASALDVALELPPTVVEPCVVTPPNPGGASEPMPPATTEAIDTPDKSNLPASASGLSAPSSPKLSNRQQQRQDRFDEVRRNNR